VSSDRAVQNPANLALLNEGGELVAELRAALQALGANIVFEAPARSLDRAALKASGARVVVINIGAASGGEGVADDELDRLSELLDADDYEIVINDSEASAQLPVSDQARWARHLAAKILRRPEITLPPAPPGAEAIPTFEQHWASRVPVADTWGVADPPPAQRDALQAAAATAAAALVTEVAPPREAEIPLDPSLEAVSDPVLDEAALSVPVGEPEPSASVGSDSDFSLALESFEASAGSASVAEDNLQDFDALFVDASIAAEPIGSDAISSETIAEPAPAREPKSKSKTKPSDKPTEAPDWSLAPVEEGETSSVESKAEPAEFGIETIPAHVYLAPQVDAPMANEGASKSADEKAAAEDFLSSLELVPLEVDTPAPRLDAVSYDTGSDLLLKTVAPKREPSSDDADKSKHDPKQDSKK
jgi:chemosensory pili system protein ChpB (putative protein-glutamate methylesterase)